jgi:hypothetical protein
VEGAVSPRSGFVAIGSLLIAACTSSEPGTEVEPEAGRKGEPLIVEPPPKPAGVERDLGPLLGGVVIERAPTPGRWSSRVQFHQHRFVTMEHTIENGISGSAVLRLGDDGVARACFEFRDTSTSDISHFQANDGKDHHYEDDHSMVVGMSGSWALDGKGPEILVTFDRMTWRTCEVDPATEPFARPPLRCFGFAANAKVPGDALLCDVPEELDWIAKLSLLTADSPRAGSWWLRNDPSLREPPVTGATPRLVLGAEPGFEMQASDTDRDAEPLTIAVKPVADPKPLPHE